MNKIKEIIDNILEVTGATNYEDIIELCMKEYGNYVLTEFQNSDRYQSLIKNSEWLNCLEQAGVDNWEGYDIAIDIRDKEI